MKVFRKLIALISMCLLVLLLSVAAISLMPMKTCANAGDLLIV